jgi:hypothetical protein
MNRCALALYLGLALALPSLAQAPRLFERNVLRGEIEVTAPPEAKLNGKPARLAPGARIRSPQNMLLLSGTLREQKLVVNYTLDGFGELRDVWVLSDAERARQPWPRTAAEAQVWTFDAVNQRWSKP